MIPRIIMHGDKVTIELDFQNKTEAINWMLEQDHINDLVEAVIAEYELKDGE